MFAQHRGCSSLVSNCTSDTHDWGSQETRRIEQWQYTACLRLHKNNVQIFLRGSTYQMHFRFLVPKTEPEISSIGYPDCLGSEALPVTASRGVATAQTVRVLSAQNMDTRTFRCVLALPFAAVRPYSCRALLQARAVLPLFAGLAGILVFANSIHGKVEISMPIHATLGRDGCLALRIIAGILISALLRVLF